MKGVFGVFLMVISFSGLVFVDIVHVDIVHAYTNVSGIINQDTLWIKTNSPYKFTGPVGIAEGVTLTIEPGTKVILNNHAFIINGTLIARGTTVDPIYFDGTMGGNINFEASSSSWNEETGTGTIIEKTILNQTNVFFCNSPKLNDNIIKGSLRSEDNGKYSPIISNNQIIGEVGCNGSPIIMNNNITGSIVAGGTPLILDNNVTGFIRSNGTPVISKNLLYGPTGFDWVGRTSYQDNGVIVGESDNAYISDNVITGFYFKSAIHVREGTSIVERNRIENLYGGESAGIIIRESAIPLIRNNSINSGIAIHCSSSSSTIIYNNINGYKYGIYLTGQAQSDVNATLNWWGTKDLQIINQSIFDNKNDFNVGNVIYTPFLSEPNPSGVPDLYAPIPTPKASQPPTLSFLLHWVEIDFITMLGVMVVLLIVVIVLIRRKRI